MGLGPGPTSSEAGGRDGDTQTGQGGSGSFPDPDKGKGWTDPARKERVHRDDPFGYCRLARKVLTELRSRSRSLLDRCIVSSGHDDFTKRSLLEFCKMVFVLNRVDTFLCLFFPVSDSTIVETVIFRSFLTEVPFICCLRFRF